MEEKTFSTPCGDIHYRTKRAEKESDVFLIFLPGLSADHRLFEKQIEYFSGKYDLLVWDAPGHADSYPFTLDFSLEDKARWLKGIMEKENIQNPLIIGQSMGGYVAQVFMELFPGTVKGFIAIDSAPMQRSYLTAAELWLLKRMEPVYRHYPWKRLKRDGTRGCAETDYGRRLMLSIMERYDDDKERYAKLVGHGYRILAEAIEANKPYIIDCPALLICGERDHAGSTKRYNRKWHEKSGIPIRWIIGAGHNANTDRPERVNEIIDSWIRQLE